MHRFSSSLICVCALAFAGIILADGVVQASNKPRRNDVAADRLVKEALVQEVYGDHQERERLLQKALVESPEYAPAMWQLGFVRFNNQWVRADDVPQLIDRDRRLKAYDTRRQETADTVEGQLELANWCNRRDLHAQERAHLSRVIELDSDHTTARARLGFVRAGGVWMTAEEIDLNRSDAREDSKDFQRWRSKILDISKRLHSRTAAIREHARDDLKLILDPRAVVALEKLLSPKSEMASMLVLEVLDRIDDEKATLSLARHAVYSPWRDVREQAAIELQDRDKMQYVPPMIGAMQTRIQSGVQVTRGRDGRLLYRHTLSQEGMDENRVVVRDTFYRRTSGGEVADGTGMDEVATDIQLASINRNLMAERQNLDAEEKNERIAEALNRATEQQLSDQPQDWWDWWQAENGIGSSGSKPDRVDYQSESVTIYDAVPAAVSQTSCECLVSGTPIWTSKGLVGVDDIQIGDLVLSQQSVTGELTYKPVLRTTVRPPTQTVRLVLADSSIQASEGHPFWVSGEGWVKAKDLKGGMELHTSNGTSRLVEVRESKTVTTYNLIVADFNTYFVGKEGVLSHDVSTREAASTIVPGLTD